MSDLHSAANAVRADEARSRPSKKVLIDGQWLPVDAAVARCLPQPVDVLAVMDDAAETLRSESFYIERERLAEARAAVAELVEAAATVERLATRHDGDDRMFDRLHAALARFGGEK